jgi:hypothetical protein
MQAMFPIVLIRYKVIDSFLPWELRDVTTEFRKHLWNRLHPQNFQAKRFVQFGFLARASPNVHNAANISEKAVFMVSAYPQAHVKVSSQHIASGLPDHRL